MQTMINDGRKLPGGQRTNVVGIAKAMAMVAAAFAPAPLLAERAAAAKAALDSPQGRLAQAVFALPHITIDFEVLGMRNARQLVAQLLLCSPAPLVEAILRLVQDVSRERSSIGGVAQAEVLRRIRTASVAQTGKAKRSPNTSVLCTPSYSQCLLPTLIASVSVFLSMVKQSARCFECNLAKATRLCLLRCVSRVRKRTRHRYDLSLCICVVTCSAGI